MRLQAMNQETGIRTEYFKLNEGKPGDGVAAFYDLPSKNLRLYCIMYGTEAIIFGGGGAKPKSARTYQEVPLLNRQAKTIQQVSKLVTQNIKSKDIVLHKDGTIICNSILENYEND